MKHLFPLIAIMLITTPIFTIDIFLQRQSKIKGIESIIKDAYPEFSTHYFPNKFDHFRPEDKRLFKQRYYTSSKYWDMQNGPIFVYICGEATCYPPKGRMFAYQLAQEHKALFQVLEHRYYGQSQLFDSWTTENLQLLTAEQALGDLAYFIESKQAEIKKKYLTPHRRRVITIGGSYPGALAAWFRYKYPHITDGSLASSAVVRQMYEFPQFDWQIANSLSRTENCLEVAGTIRQGIDNYLDSGKQEDKAFVYNLFNAGENYDVADFMVYINELWVEKVQYGKRTEICDHLVSLKDLELNDQIKGLADYALKNNLPAGPDGISSVQDTTYNENSNMRQWNWQVCTNMGYLFIPSLNSPITSPKLDLNYWLNYCKRAFGRETDPKEGIQQNNILQGNVHLRGSNIFFTNGVEDGWQWASVRKITSRENNSMQAHVIDCEDCGHCQDLHDERIDDAEDLKRTRRKIRKHVKRWLKGDGFPLDKLRNGDFYSDVSE